MTPMTRFTAPAVTLRRVEYGDHDLILTLFTRDRGKLAVIAKNAKKSTRRFAGKLELFSAISVLCSPGRKGGLPVLQEAELIHPHAGIRTSMLKTAFASYWAELVSSWMEEGEPVEGLYDLMLFALNGLAEDLLPETQLSILFQMRFLILSGLCPNLRTCCTCRTELEEMPRRSAMFDLKRGSVTCDRFECGTSGEILLSKGTIKQLHWIETGDLAKAARSRFTPEAVSEAEAFIERFVLFHLGRQPKSLAILKQIRRRD